MLLTDKNTINISIKKNAIPVELVEPLRKKLIDLDIYVQWLISEDIKDSSNVLVTFSKLSLAKNYSLNDYIEEVIKQIPFDFDSLKLLVEGESKIIRLLNDKIVVEKFKPTIYSYTHNRYGVVNNTDNLRVKFTSEVFRQMNRYADKTGKKLKNAFLACITRETDMLIVQERMKTSNLEIRVKRFHVGSPVHRYRFTENYKTLQEREEPLLNWTRFDKPVVCFDWRHPLIDENSNRLADEPISDDYAAIWMKNIPEAKLLATQTFKWLEKLFSKANLVLVDICFFINEDGNCVFGEISPDCMRVRENLNHEAKSYDKDIWRKGGTTTEIAEQYEALYNLIFLIIKRFIMEFQVKNKRLKMSPNGVITLPVSARKALGMTINEAKKISIKIDGEKVILSGKYTKKDKTWRVSKNGIMELKAEAKQSDYLKQVKEGIIGLILMIKTNKLQLFLINFIKTLMIKTLIT